MTRYEDKTDHSTRFVGVQFYKIMLVVDIYMEALLIHPVSIYFDNL